MNRSIKKFIFFLIIYFALTYVSSFLLSSERVSNDFGLEVFGLYRDNPDVAAGHSAGFCSLIFFFLFQKCVLYVFCGHASFPQISL